MGCARTARISLEYRLMKALIVDDDPKFRDYVHRGLNKFGVSSRTAADAEAAHAAMLAEDFDMVLLDVLMPGRSGWDFIEQLRAEGDETPVIFVTARHEVVERVRGLELGADDYIVKPFELNELVARIHAVHRRRGGPTTLVAGDLSINVPARTVDLAGRRIELSSRQFDVLRVLIERRGQVLSRVELLQRVWGIEFDPGTNVVEVAVARLRRRLAPAGHLWIETVTGEGYRFRAREGA